MIKRYRTGWPVLSALLLGLVIFLSLQPQPQTPTGEVSRVRDSGGNRPALTVQEPNVAPLQSVVAGDKFRFPMPGRGFMEATIHCSQQDSSRPALWTLGGEIGDDGGSIYLAEDAEHGVLSGVVLLRDRREAWVYSRRGTGPLTVEEVLASDIVCTGPDGLPPFGPGGTSAATPAPGPGIVMLGSGAAGTVPNCSSRPSATSVLYLDFEGGSITQSFWNCGRTITYESAGMDSNQMVSLWAQVAEDYASFDVNVTTNRSVYTNAVIGRRMRMVLAKTSWASLKAGFAALGSFPNAGGYWSERNRLVTNIGIDPHKSVMNGATPLPANCGLTAIIYPSDIVCWGFGEPLLRPLEATVPLQVSWLARAAAHELGHTFGLLHDSSQFRTIDPYYDGHGTGADQWGALMGFNLTEGLAQWSKGEYEDAVNLGWGKNAMGDNLLQDDLAIIGTGVSGGSGTGLIPDDKGDTQGAAALMSIDGIGAVNDRGIIHIGTDVDCFRISVVPSTAVISLVISASGPDPNLDVYAELQNSSGTVLTSNAQLLSRNATIGPITVTNSGNYYLMVRGFGQGTGWSRYGSLGNYSITGSVTSNEGVPVITANSLLPDGSVGIAYSSPLTATNNPTSYYLVSGAVPPGLLLSGGNLSGTPATQGWYNFTLAAANAQGGASKFFTMYVFGPESLPDSLDTSTLTWTTRSYPTSTDPATLWQGQRAITEDGSDAARSGTSGANSESWLETTATGPGTVTFYWRTSSHAGDRLVFRVDNNTDLASISGETGWAQRSFSIAQGTHSLRWIYLTDSGVTAGQNAGFVDRVSFTRVPQFSEGNFYAGGVMGQPFYWQIETDNNASSWTLTGGSLPPGITLDPATGLLTGTPAAVGVYSPEITATNDGGSNTTYPNIYIYPNVELATAVDAAGLTWISGGANPWFGDTTTMHDGVDAAHSGPIRHGLNSWMQTTLTGPGNFSFWWKASTEATGDPVYFSIDGVIQSSLSGEVDWTQRNHSIPSGAHTLRWEYIRDGNGNGGQNMAWVDQVSWITPGPAITSPLTANWTCGQTYLVFLTSDDPNVIWTTGNLPADVSFSGSPVNAVGAAPKRPGTSYFYVFATNQAGTTTTRQFTINVESSYAAWARSKGLAPGTELGDPDRDGIPNIAELAYALDPLAGNNGFPPIGYEPVTRHLQAIFKRKHQYYPDLKYEVQTSNNLTLWDTIAHVSNGTTVTNVSAGSVSEIQLTAAPDYIYEVTVKDATAQSGSTPKRSMRLKISQQ